MSPTPSGDIKVTGISIIGEASIDGVSGTYSVSYSPRLQHRKALTGLSFQEPIMLQSILPVS